MLGDPEFVLGAIQTDRQRALLPELEALVCVVEGCVDHFADEIASGLVTNQQMISEAFRRRRVEAEAKAGRREGKRPGAQVGRRRGPRRRLAEERRHRQVRSQVRGRRRRSRGRSG